MAAGAGPTDKLCLAEMPPPTCGSRRGRAGPAAGEEVQDGRWDDEEDREGGQVPVVDRAVAPEHLVRGLAGLVDGLTSSSAWTLMVMPRVRSGVEVPK